ncbi:MAG: cytochrome c biogenesis heme-transporting ATPase CcmA [Pseudomonadota bacterium]|nr:cytochrome c biogenesis heme-transporting ATPase CcmA [Pseudomonadota bacterium]
MNEALSDMDAAAPGLEVRGLACTRGERLLFTDLNFSLAAGQALLIEGPNGSGKTSLLRLLCGLGLADAGEIRWCGRDVDDYRTEFLTDIAYVGHANGIKLDLTARENVDFTRALGCPRPQLAAAGALAALGLKRLEDTPCRKLSAGQRRRVALARLLVLNARLWLLDEPLSALDARVVLRFEELLRAHLDDGGLLILTTHRPIDLGQYEVKRIVLGA